MEANEIMTNNEVTEVVETASDEVTKVSSNQLRSAAIGGLTVLIGGLAVKYVVKPIVAKIKAKKKYTTVSVIDESIMHDDENDFEEEIDEK